MMDELATKIDSIQDSVKQHMDAESVDTVNDTDWRVTYKAVTSSRLDTGVLKKALPDVAERFSKTTTDQSKAQRAITTNQHNGGQQSYYTGIPPKKLGGNFMDISEWVKQEILKMTDDECNVFLALLQRETIKRGEAELVRAHNPQYQTEHANDL